MAEHLAGFEQRWLDLLAALAAEAQPNAPPGMRETVPQVQEGCRIGLTEDAIEWREVVVEDLHRGGPPHSAMERERPLSTTPLPRDDLAHRNRGSGTVSAPC